MGGLDLTHRSTRYLGACDEGDYRHLEGRGRARGEGDGNKKNSTSIRSSSM